MLTFILIAAIASTLVFFFTKKTAKPEPSAEPEITEQEIQAELNSHVEEISVAPVVEPTPIINPDKLPVIAAAKKKPAAKKKAKKVDA